MKKNSYDTIIIGCGTAGIFAGYELQKLVPGMNILMLEQGRGIYSRLCPIVEKKVPTCINCNSCGIMNGFGGAGAFSDGKYNFTTQFGGWLNEYLDTSKIMELIEYVDTINVGFGATLKRFSTNSPEAREISRKALSYDLHLLEAEVKHFGTENNRQILTKMFDYLNEKVEISCDAGVESFEPLESGYMVTLTNGETAMCRHLIVAPGRSGAEWFAAQCRKLNLQLINNQVDIGVRVELPARVFESITDIVYESKFLYRTKQYGDMVRTFCMNPYGHVVSENVDGIITVNGHSYTDPAFRSENTNFAILVSNRFTKPFNEPYQYGKRIASLSNMLGGGILVQRFGDLIKGKRTNEHRLAQSFTVPTMKATPGDLSLVLTKRHLDNIIEMINALDKIAPGSANYDTLLYGVEVKFYSSRLLLNNEFETELPGFYAIGDGAGITRGLSQAAASGVHVARVIAQK
ncbi:MAG: NAD(P)/FAD-dependent oxidoreductase [Clostridiaceae bacterium]|nr:NAD(P)/FAD-dependent oxidoreductase [Clostridiaceae bacterium]